VIGHTGTGDIGPPGSPLWAAPYSHLRDGEMAVGDCHAVAHGMGR